MKKGILELLEEAYNRAVRLERSSLPNLPETVQGLRWSLADLRTALTDYFSAPLLRQETIDLERLIKESKLSDEKKDHLFWRIDNVYNTLVDAENALELAKNTLEEANDSLEEARILYRTECENEGVDE